MLDKNVIIKKVKIAAVVIAFGLAYLFFYKAVGIGIPCMFSVVTGLKCPGCGMTRAAVEIWNGDYRMALEYNPLSLTVMPILCLYLVYRSIYEASSKKDNYMLWEKILLAILLVIVLAFGIARNIL